MSFTLTTSAAILYLAGENNPMLGNANSAAIIAKLSDQAEGKINSLTRYDWVANYSSIGTNFKPLLDDTAAAYAAIGIVKYNMSSYFPGEAATMLNVLRDNFQENMKALKDEASVRIAMGAQ